MNFAGVSKSVLRGLRGQRSIFIETHLIFDLVLSLFPNIGQSSIFIHPDGIESDFFTLSGKTADDLPRDSDGEASFSGIQCRLESRGGDFFESFLAGAC